MINRRSWLKKSIIGLTGAAILSPLDLQAMEEESHTLFSQLSQKDTDEGYWELIKSNFVLQEGLRYFQ
jgi:hypothetical protein